MIDTTYYNPSTGKVETLTHARNKSPLNNKTMEKNRLSEHAATALGFAIFLMILAIAAYLTF
jgi:hypothetical protein